ncbi:GNAT family N-acetyltransferase [Natronoglycomyces albus]|uniref:GNAT family N-acetyltransferase n=1 Tax=Natronoglycomyces albus TaxID=2811108 RepID=A0A895XQB3_9ACTN|nr:GNAT family protein [Natronoglycomyces albus]QSB04460.1 GNAT family N-acetyltransferase [Natronoglycomyces albus]
MEYDYFPAYGIRIRTQRLEMRLPTFAELNALAQVAIEGIHPADEMPFIFPWSTQPPMKLGRGLLQHHWSMLSTWTPQKWSLQFGVFVDGAIVGAQDIAARDFSVTKEIKSGSWLSRRVQGQGIGTEMRRAMLHFAFVGLGAEEACSGAYVDNVASNRVSAKVGYRLDGIERSAVEGRLRETNRFRLSRTDWEMSDRIDVRMEGVQEALPMFLGEENV